MISDKHLHLLKIYNLSISIYIASTFVIQVLMVLLRINASAIISVFMVVTIASLFFNIVLILVVLFLVLFKKQNRLAKPFAWGLINQIGLFFSLIVLFSTIMTIVNF